MSTATAERRLRGKRRREKVAPRYFPAYYGTPCRTIKPEEGYRRLTVRLASQRKQVTLGATRKCDRFLSRYAVNNSGSGMHLKRR